LFRFTCGVFYEVTTVDNFSGSLEEWQILLGGKIKYEKSVQSMNTYLTL